MQAWAFDKVTHSYSKLYFLIRCDILAVKSQLDFVLISNYLTMSHWLLFQVVTAFLQSDL